MNRDLEESEVRILEPIWKPGLDPRSPKLLHLLAIAKKSRAAADGDIALLVDVGVAQIYLAMLIDLSDLTRGQRGEKLQFALRIHLQCGERPAAQ